METRTAAPILPPNATVAAPQDQKKALAEVSFTETPRVAAPLLSIAAAAYVLGLLYFPRYLLSFLLSPVAFFSTLLLAALLQYYLGFFPGAARPDPQTRPPKSQHHPHRLPEDHQPPPPPPSMEQRQHNYADAAPRGPLEIIYEEYEGEDDEEEEDGVGSPDPGRSGRRCQGLELLQLRRLCSRDDDDESDDEGSVLSGRCSSSPRPWDSPENLCFHWEVEEEDGLIEISLEEDSLIEIDLSAPCR